MLMPGMCRARFCNRMGRAVFNLAHTQCLRPSRRQVTNSALCIREICGQPSACPFMTVRQYVSSRWENAKNRFMLVLAFVGVLWVIYTIDFFLPNKFFIFQDWGVRPRSLRGIIGIACAPFLHGNVWHLMANTVQLVAMGWLLVLSGKGIFLRVVSLTALCSGLGAWFFGSGESVHLGASGVAMGLQGFLMGRGWFARKISWALVALFVTTVYFGFRSLVPDPNVSWSSHFWGFASGFCYSWWLYGRDVFWRKGRLAMLEADFDPKK